MAERQFGPYRLVKQIAVGGMAELHLAKTRGIAGFEKYVALKMIHPNFSQDENFIEMLIDEAKISVQLQHVNVAQTFDLGRVGDTYYITMEYVDGADLYKFLRRASEQGIHVPVDIAAYIAKEVANGLDYAHRRRDVHGKPMGIVHRDISPQNVLISHSGEVKLVDFGIAKATMKARQTAVGVIKGKYYYMSPEQAWGDGVDHRTDIFSTGILLYEALVGQMLYLEEDLHRLLEMVRKADIKPPTTLRRDIPPQLERIVMNALKQRREDRYQSAGDMATDLERFLHVYSPVFTPAKLSEFVRRVLTEEEPPPPTIEVEPERPSVSTTQRLESEFLLRERSEFSDENSVIFRMSDMERKMKQGGSAPGRGRAPVPQVSVVAELDNIEEQTMISAPPGFGGLRPRSGGGGDDFAADFEPTLVDGSEEVAEVEPDEDYDDMDEAETLQHDKRQVNQMMVGAAAGRQPARRPGTSPKRGRGPAHPALSASTPQPAVSELRGPRQVRKTPGQGVPAAGGGSSLLSALVGGPGDAGAPVRRTPPPDQGMPGQGMPQGLPGQAMPQGLPGQAMQAGMPQGMPGQGMPGQAMQAGMPQGMPGQGMPQGMPGQGMPGNPYQGNAAYFGPGGVPVNVPPGMQRDGFSALPTGNVPLSMTKQLQALELEEIPDSYKLGRKKPRWLLPVILAAVCGVAGVVTGVMLFAGGGKPVETALLIDSKPSGAKVKVNGEELAETTPVRWPGAEPNQRYKLEFALGGYKPYSKDVMVGSKGGDIQVTVVLLQEATRVTLEVESNPSRAEIILNDKSYGSTPRTLTGLDPKKATRLELRLKGYKTHEENLEWGGTTRLERNITLNKTSQK